MTLPSPYRNLSKINGNLLYNLLFKAASKVLQSWFKDTHGILPGIISVLHTAGSDLKYHPHVHMIVTGGGRELKTDEFVELKGSYLCPQRLLGKRLKIEFNKLLVESYKKGDLLAFRSITSLTELKTWLGKVNKKHWIVSIQKPLENLEQIVGYVGRYTKRCCLSEYKIEGVGNGKVTFAFNDYKNTARGDRPKKGLKVMKLPEFFDSLLQHVPTPGFKMVRYSGLYNSYHLKRIPSSRRGKVAEPLSKETVDELSREWGEYEDFRKKSIQIGRPDPLYCESCGKDFVLIEIVYKKKRKLVFVNDS